ncbi:MAG: hypothetical protein U0271_16070 [Polyangiaceae bacterium]
MNSTFTNIAQVRGELDRGAAPPVSNPTSAEQAVEPAALEPALPEPVAPRPVSRPNAPPENLTGEVDLSTFRAAMLPFVTSSSASPPAIPPINPTPQPPARLPDVDATAEVDLRAIVVSLP